MTSIVSYLIYLSLFMLCVGIEIKRNKKWDSIFYPKSRFDSKAIDAIYCISFVCMTFFTIINLIIGDTIELCICIILCGLAMLLSAFFLSKTYILITNDKIIKKSLFGKTIINIKSIKSIETGYFIKIKSKNNLIVLETKFYDSGIINIKKRLNEINISVNK